jgi:hypothetical protein
MPAMPENVTASYSTRINEIIAHRLKRHELVVEALGFVRADSLRRLQRHHRAWSGGRGCRWVNNG